MLTCVEHMYFFCQRLEGLIYSLDGTTVRHMSFESLYLCVTEVQEFVM